MSKRKPCKFCDIPCDNKWCPVVQEEITEDDDCNNDDGSSVNLPEDSDDKCD